MKIGNIRGRKKRGNRYDALIISDTHGIFVDPKCIDIICGILQNSRVDELILNGDVFDFPYLSRHGARLIEHGVLEGYTEIDEIAFTKSNIIDRLANSNPNTQIRIRYGNHDDRVADPFFISKWQMKRLNEIMRYYRATSLEEIILKDAPSNVIVDDSDYTKLFDNFLVVHGGSITENAPDKNMRDFGISGTSGHSHRLGSKYRSTHQNNPHGWWESGCMRTKEDIEYLAKGNPANWMQGFVSYSYSADTDKFYASTHGIIDGTAYYDGVVYG